MTRSQATPASSQIIAMERMIEERDETIAAQAAVIEKLKQAFYNLAIICDKDNDVSGWFEVNQAMFAPTDSKEVLKAWLDEVLGEPVGWLQTNVEDGGATTLVRNHMPAMFNPEWWKFEPLFRKPEVTK